MADARFMKLGVTSGGKEIGYKQSTNAALYEICFGSGGELHDSLKGKFVSPRDAEITIQNYLANHQKKPAVKKTATKKKVA